MTPRSRGWTLIELLVTLSIITLLMGLLLPALGQSRSTALRLECLSQLRQMGIAAEVYLHTYDGFYPPAYWTAGGVLYTWEITTLPGPQHVPGVLWQGQGTITIQQCPSYDGPDNWTDAPYTGYNYNTSYLGRDAAPPSPARQQEVRQPSQCAVFGDGGYSGGANKFMRSPQPSPSDAFFSARYAGAQAFRHQDATNAVFADGHGRTLHERFTAGDPNVAPGTGFLSEDNELYDLE